VTARAFAIHRRDERELETFVSETQRVFSGHVYAYQQTRTVAMGSPTKIV
jgi:hypothetical protein